MPSFLMLPSVTIIIVALVTAIPASIGLGLGVHVLSVYVEALFINETFVTTQTLESFFGNMYNLLVVLQILEKMFHIVLIKNSITHDIPVTTATIRAELVPVMRSTEHVAKMACPKSSRVAFLIHIMSI